MTAIEYLRGISILDSQIKRREKLMEEARSLAFSSCGSIDYSAIRVNHSSSNNQMDKVIKLVDSEKELREEIRALHIKKRNLLDRIERIENNKYCQILWLHYVEQKTLMEISEIMGYSYDRIRHLHSESVAEFEIKNQDILKLAQNSTDKHKI